MTLQTFRTVAQLRTAISEHRKAGKRIGLVPTMGALHEGHLALVDKARENADMVAVSLFVNPTQFGPGEDLDRYPRDEEGDKALLESRGADILWAPEASEMYPEGFCTSVHLKGPALELETDFRPHFFQGVATVVSKLLLQVLPDVAVFGEKDYQQLQVIRRLVTDLNIPTEIIGMPTVREADGLAMSSRNRYLSEAERPVAVALSRVLRETGAAVLKGELPAEACRKGEYALIDAGFTSVDYVAVRHAHSLAEVSQKDVAAGIPLRVLGAAKLGTTRLIDNLDPRDT